MHIPGRAFAAAEFREPINLIAAYHVRWKGSRERTMHSCLRGAAAERKILSLTSLITDYRSSTFVIVPSYRLVRPKSKPTHRGEDHFHLFGGPGGERRSSSHQGWGEPWRYTFFRSKVHSRSHGIIVTRAFSGKQPVCRNFCFPVFNYRPHRSSAAATRY